MIGALSLLALLLAPDAHGLDMPLAQAASHHDPGWRTTRAALELADKRWFVDRVLGGGWNGDPQRDFADLCRRPEEEMQRP